MTLRPSGGDSVVVRAVDDLQDDSRWFGDEVAIDFPSIAPAVDRMRSAFVAAERSSPLRTWIDLSPYEARRGATLPLDVPVLLCLPYLRRPRRVVVGAVRAVCRHRHGNGAPPGPRRRVPAGVSDGALFRFTVTPRHHPATREVELHVRVAGAVSAKKRGTRGGTPRIAVSASWRAYGARFAAIIGVASCCLSAGALVELLAPLEASELAPAWPRSASPSLASLLCSAVPTSGRRRCCAGTSRSAASSCWRFAPRQPFVIPFGTALGLRHVGVAEERSSPASSPITTTPRRAWPRTGAVRQIERAARPKAAPPGGLKPPP